MRYIIADCETPSLDPTHGVCEVAFMEISEYGDVIWQDASLIDPECPISPGAAGVHGIRDADVADSPTLAEYMEVVHAQPFLGEESIFIAHNSKFDHLRLGHWFNSPVQLCTLKLARKLWPDAENHKLQTLRMHLELPFVRGDAHSALGDVEVCRQIILRGMRDFDLTMLEMIDLANAPVEITRMVFGKHKGELIKDMPKQYITWALGKLELDPDLRKALEAAT